MWCDTFGHVLTGNASANRKLIPDKQHVFQQKSFGWIFPLMIAHDQCWQRTEMPDNNGSVGEEMEASIDPLSVWGVVTEQQSTSRVG